MKDVIGFLYNWQTLITGVMALVGAWITIRAVRRQSNDDAERKRRASRAMLPATLDAVHLYALATIQWLRSTKEKVIYLEQGKYANQPLSTGTSPRLDGETSKALQACVENFHLPEARFAAGLLSRAQVLQSNVSSLSDYFENHSGYQVKRVGLLREVNQQIANAVELVALVARAFPFARNEQETVDGSVDLYAIRNAFKLCFLNEVQEVEAWNLATNRFLSPQAQTSSAER